MSEIIIEQQLKDRCTPDAIKWMVELAEGFEISRDAESREMILYSINHSGLYLSAFCNHDLIFPLLIHRTVEGWNKKAITKHIDVFITIGIVALKISADKKEDKYMYYMDYQPQSLTYAECAMLDCLLDIFEEKRK